MKCSFRTQLRRAAAKTWLGLIVERKSKLWNLHCFSTVEKRELDKLRPCINISSNPSTETHSHSHLALWMHLLWPIAFRLHTSFPTEEGCCTSLLCQPFAAFVSRQKCHTNPILCTYTWCFKSFTRVVSKPNVEMNGRWDDERSYIKQLHSFLLFSHKTSQNSLVAHYKYRLVGKNA